MLERSELQELAQWCHGHAIRWMPAAAAEGDRTAMILEANERQWGWHRVVLVLSDDGFSVLTEHGETVASASDLTAVLDTLIDATEPPGRRSRAGAMLRRRLMAPSLSFVL